MKDAEIEMELTAIQMAIPMVQDVYTVAKQVGVLADIISRLIDRIVTLENEAKP